MSRNRAYPEECWDFNTFRDCRFGAKCRRVHNWSDTGLSEQDFYIANIRSITSHRNVFFVEVLLPDGNTKKLSVNGVESLKNATRGDTVIIHQVSKEPLMKVVAVLHGQTILNFPSALLENKVKCGFTLGQRVKAYTINDCDQHDKECKCIGVHIVATALSHLDEKLDPCFVPFHRSAKGRQNEKSGVSAFDSFEVDSIRMSLTVYSHSSCDEVEGPYITPIILKQAPDHYFRKPNEYESAFSHLWKCFGKPYLIQDVSKTWRARFIVECRQDWKENLVIDRSKVCFNKQITAYMKEKKQIVIARFTAPNIDIPDKTVTIPEERINQVEAVIDSPSRTSLEEKLAMLFGSSKRASNVLLDENFTEMYHCEVHPGHDVPEGKVVESNKPSEQTLYFINQQVVFSTMFLPEQMLYTKEDVLGILLKKWDTPKLLRSIIRRVTQKQLLLQFLGLRTNWKQINKQILLKQLFRSHFLSSDIDEVVEEDSENESKSAMQIVLNGVCSDNYCNTTVVHLDGALLSQASDNAIRYGIESTQLKASIADVIARKSVEDVPFQSDERGTLVNLKPGAELQLQVSVERGQENKYGYLRLLRVGKDCHICLAHLNFPSKAFMCNRLDTQELITRDRIKKMEQDIAKGALKTQILQNIVIIWNNCYFSGGRFVASDNVAVGSPLCIRKEIQTDCICDFVWTCHAVVTRNSGKVIEFAVASLLQDQTKETVSWVGEFTKFLVEVISIED